MVLLHPFGPVFDERSETLIVGTFPSIKSREVEFFYGHPQNRFWKMLAGVFGEAVPTDITEKMRLLLEHKIALWDVLESCEIEGSADANIRSAKPNDLSKITDNSNITKVLCNGKKAFELYNRFNKSAIPVTLMPSTSPANAAFSLERLISIWQNNLQSEAYI
jgi:hypoxanthine-DNA glycosylase